MTTAPEILSKSQFAARIGCQPSYVTALLKAGRLVMTEDGKRIRVAESIARIAATKDPAATQVATRHADARGTTLAAPSPAEAAGQGTAPPPEDGDDAPQPTDTPAYQHWRARRERANALQQEAALGESTRALLQADIVASAVTAAITLLRNDLEAIPDRIAPQLAAETDEARINAMLREEVEGALGNASGHLFELGRDQK